MFKLQLPSKYSPSDAIHLLRCFFHCSRQFLNLSMLIPFSASSVFLFYLFNISKMFAFEDFFHVGKQKKNLLGVKSGEEGGWGKAVMPVFDQKLLNTQTVWTGALINHPS